MKTKVLEFCMTSVRYPDEARTSGRHMGIAPESSYLAEHGYIRCTVCGKLLKLRADRIPSHGIYLPTIPTHGTPYIPTENSYKVVREFHPGMSNEALKSYEGTEAKLNIRETWNRYVSLGR